MSCSQISSFRLTKVNSPPWAGASAGAACSSAGAAAAGPPPARLPLAIATSWAPAADGSAREEAGGPSGFLSGRTGSVPKVAALQFLTEAGNRSATARQAQKSGQNQKAAAKPAASKARTANSRLTGCRLPGFSLAST